MENVMGNEKKFECDQCLESFNRNFSLTLHKTVIHSNAKTLKCKQSGKIYNIENKFESSHNFQVKSTEDDKKSRSNSTESLNRYEEPPVKEKKSSSIKSYQNLTDFKCDTCDQTLRSNKAMEKHVDSVHNRKKEFICDNCEKTFTSKRSMHKHVNTVHNK